MTKFVVAINLICRYLMEANTKEEAEKLVWNHRNVGFDLTDVDEHTTSAMTKDEYDSQHDSQHTDSSLLLDLDLGRDAWHDVLKAHFKL